MENNNCIFCKIIAGEIPSTKIYEDDTVLAFKDINPQAPVHVLIVPKRHISTFNDLTEADEELITHIFMTAKNIANQLGCTGYKLHINVGEKGGQEVMHLHLHLLGYK